MKLFSAFVFCLGVALAAFSDATTDSCVKSDPNETEETLFTRERRYAGLDDDYGKELEIRTKSGSGFKLSKDFGFNDERVIANLPAFLDSVTRNKIRILQQVQNNRYHTVYGVSKIKEHVDAASKFTGGRGIFGSREGLKGLLAAKYEQLLARKLANSGHHAYSHGKVNDAVNGKIGGSAVDPAGERLADNKLAGVSVNRPIEDSYCPTGSYCAGN